MKNIWRIPVPLTATVLVVVALTAVYHVHGQEAKTPAQVAHECVGADAVLAKNISDGTPVDLPAGKAMSDYQVAYGAEKDGQPNAVCVRTRPFGKGETAEVHQLLFGNGRFRFDIVEHDLIKKRFYSK